MPIIRKALKVHFLCSLVLVLPKELHNIFRHELARLQKGESRLGVFGKQHHLSDFRMELVGSAELRSCLMCDLENVFEGRTQQPMFANEEVQVDGGRRIHMAKLQKNVLRNENLEFLFFNRLQRLNQILLPRIGEKCFLVETEQNGSFLVGSVQSVELSLLNDALFHFEPLLFLLEKALHPSSAAFEDEPAQLVQMAVKLIPDLLALSEKLLYFKHLLRKHTTLTAFVSPDEETQIELLLQFEGELVFGRGGVEAYGEHFREIDYLVLPRGIYFHLAVGAENGSFFVLEETESFSQLVMSRLLPLELILVQKVVDVIEEPGLKLFELSQ